MNKYDGENVEVVITMGERERPEMKRDSGTHCDRSGETRKGRREAHVYTRETI